MKKILLLATGILLTFTTATQAQYLSLGPVVSFGDNWIGHPAGTSKFMPSGSLGIGFIYTQKSHWAWGAELKGSLEGYKMEDAYGNTATATPIYLRLPIHAYYFFGKYGDKVRPKLYLGPTFGLKLGESDDMNGVNSDLVRNMGTFRTFDFGLNAGAGVNIRLASRVWLNMDLGYYQGLLDAVDDPAGNYNVNHNLAFNAGVLFGLNK